MVLTQRAGITIQEILHQQLTSLHRSIYFKVLFETHFIYVFY